MARKGENITKRKDGRWEARIIKGRTLDGKARYQYIYGKSYSEVRRKKKIISAHKHMQNRTNMIPIFCFRKLLLNIYDIFKTK